MVKLNNMSELSIIEKNGGIEVTVLTSNEVGQIVSEVSNAGLVKGLVKDLTSNQIKLLELIETAPNVTKEEIKLIKE